MDNIKNKFQRSAKALRERGLYAGAYLDEEGRVVAPSISIIMKNNKKKNS